MDSGFDSYDHSIDVLTQMSNCSFVTSVWKCMNFPGCMYCLGLPPEGEFRILSEGSDSNNDDFKEAYYAGHSNYKRKLYARIVPVYHDEITDDEIIVNGYCSTGFISSEACEQFESSASHNSHDILVLSVLIALIIL